MNRLRNWPLSVMSGLLAAVLLSAGLTAAWISWTLFDADRYVAVFAPLSQDERVQSYLVEEVERRVAAAVDLPELPFIDTGAIEEQIVITAGERARTFVESDEFAQAWETGVRGGHRIFLAAANDPDARGILRFDLGPTADRVASLSGIPAQFTEDVADRLRDEGEVVLLQSGRLAAAQRNANLLRSAGWALPLVAVLLLAVAVIAAPNRLRSLLVVGASILLSALGLFVAIEAGRIAAIEMSRLPDPITRAIYEQATTGAAPLLLWMSGIGGVLMVLGIAASVLRRPR